MVDWVLPDAKFDEYPDTTGASIQITFYSKMYPGDTPRVQGPVTFTSTTRYLNTRIRGRLVAFKWESSDLDSWWRIGGMRTRVAQDGRL
jgi:hypothetical protein